MKLICSDFIEVQSKDPMDNTETNGDRIYPRRITTMTVNRRFLQTMVLMSEAVKIKISSNYPNKTRCKRYTLHAVISDALLHSQIKIHIPL